jgi:hypothetical protein
MAGVATITGPELLSFIEEAGWSLTMSASLDSAEKMADNIGSPLPPDARKQPSTNSSCSDALLVGQDLGSFLISLLQTRTQTSFVK